MDDVFLGQAVQHRGYFLQQLLGSRFIGSAAQFFDSRAGRLVLVAVQYAFRFVAADALDSRLMVCHNKKRTYKKRPTGRVFECGSAKVESNFQLLKKNITEQPIFRLPNFGKPFQVKCDASVTTIGVVLSQEDNLVAYFSEN